PLRVIRPSAGESAAHAAYLAGLAKECGEAPGW
ncbi:MAG: hypothetical protein FD132_2256, partial [bacterium]